MNNFIIDADVNLVEQPIIECDRDNCCLQESSPSVSTCIYFPPTYDKYENNTNSDSNTTSDSMKCSACNREWSTTTQFGKTTYKEITS